MRTKSIYLFTFFVFFFAFITRISAQDSAISSDTITNKCIANDTIVQLLVEKDAQFQGGDLLKFRKYIMTRLRYPIHSLQRNQQGKVFIKFIVNWDGKIKDVVVFKSSGYTELDDEAVRVVCQSPDWTSAKNKNICVPQQLILPVEFKSLGIINRVPQKR